MPVATVGGYSIQPCAPKPSAAGVAGYPRVADDLARGLQGPPTVDMYSTMQSSASSLIRPLSGSIPPYLSQDTLSPSPMVSSSDLDSQTLGLRDRDEVRTEGWTSVRALRAVSASLGMRAASLSRARLSSKTAVIVGGSGTCQLLMQPL